jgi:NhaA family Na+:H+ antiporter
MLHSGIHATIAGVLLAFTFPFGDGSEQSASYQVEQALIKPVAFIILPVFALANTSIHIQPNWYASLIKPHTLGILSGLMIGKPLGIFLFSFVTVSFGFCALPQNVTWRQLLGLGLLGGIGFTMSIFITLLAFNDRAIIDQAKIAVLLASLCSGFLGYLLLRKSDLRDQTSYISKSESR